MKGKQNQTKESGNPISQLIPVINVKLNDFVMLKGFPCQVNHTQTSLPGKHMIKTYFTGIDIFTGKKYEEIFQSTLQIESPFVKQQEYQLIDISDDNYLSLLLENGETKEDVKISNDELQMAEKLRTHLSQQKDIYVTILSAMEQEKLISYRTI